MGQVGARPRRDVVDRICRLTSQFLASSGFPIISQCARVRPVPSVTPYLHSFFLLVGVFMGANSAIPKKIQSVAIHRSTLAVGGILKVGGLVRQTVMTFSSSTSRQVI